MSKEVVVLSAARSAIGSFGGSLSNMEPSELAGVVMKEAIARSGVDPQLIGNAVVGNCIPTDSRYAYVSRVASIQAGLPMDSIAMQVSRLCSSGLQGIVTAAQNIMLGDFDYGIGGGVEVMSRGGYLMPALRTGARMGDTKAVDMMVAVLTRLALATWASPQKISRPSGISRVKSRTPSPLNRSVAQPWLLPKAVSSRRSCRSSSKPARATSCSTPMNTSRPVPRSSRWPR
jgi:hypothetical protein